METLLNAIGLVVIILDYMTKVFSDDRFFKKQSIGRELSSIVVKLDSILSRAKVILTSIMSLTSSEAPDLKIAEQLENTISDQIKELDHLAANIDKFLRHEEVAKVMAIYGAHAEDDNKFYLLKEKQTRLWGMLTLVSNVCEYSQKPGLVVYDYKLSLVNEAEWKKLATSRKFRNNQNEIIDQGIREGWLIRHTVDLRHPPERRKYQQATEKQIEMVKHYRDEFVDFLKKNFSIEEIL